MSAPLVTRTPNVSKYDGPIRPNGPSDRLVVVPGVRRHQRRECRRADGRFRRERDAPGAGNRGKPIRQVGNRGQRRSLHPGSDTWKVTTPRGSRPGFARIAARKLRPTIPDTVSNVSTIANWRQPTRTGIFRRNYPTAALRQHPGQPSTRNRQPDAADTASDTAQPDRNYRMPPAPGLSPAIPVPTFFTAATYRGTKGRTQLSTKKASAGARGAHQQGFVEVGERHAPTCCSQCQVHAGLVGPGHRAGYEEAGHIGARQQQEQARRAIQQKNRGLLHRRHRVPQRLHPMPAPGDEMLFGFRGSQRCVDFGRRWLDRYAGLDAYDARIDGIAGIVAHTGTGGRDGQQDFGARCVWERRRVRRDANHADLLPRPARLQLEHAAHHRRVRPELRSPQRFCHDRGRFGRLAEVFFRAKETPRDRPQPQRAKIAGIDGRGRQIDAVAALEQRYQALLADHPNFGDYRGLGAQRPGVRPGNGVGNIPGTGPAAQGEKAIRPRKFERPPEERIGRVEKNQVDTNPKPRTRIAVTRKTRDRSNLRR